MHCSEQVQPISEVEVDRARTHVDGDEHDEGDDDGQQQDPVQVGDHDAAYPPAGGSEPSLSCSEGRFRHR